MFLMNTFRFGTAAWNSDKSLLFDGVNEVRYNTDKTAFKFIHETGTFGVSVWFKTSDYTANSLTSIMGTNRIASASKGFAIYYENRSSQGSPKFLKFYGSNNNTAPENTWLTMTTANNVIADNDWHHILCTSDGGTNNKIYLDGVDLTLSVETTGTLPTGNQTYHFNIGMAGSDSGNYFPWYGYIDECSIWDDYVSSSDASELYNSGCPTNLSDHTSVANIVDWWGMGEADTITTMTDLIGSYDLIHRNMESEDITTETPC